MKLVIAEKPSVAQAIAVVIGADQRRDGYLEGNGYKVSWCIGHLAGLASADVYEPRYAKWRYEDLPIIPREWKLAVGKEKQKQFDILKRLMNASDVDSVINACDAGREGEAIFRTVYELAGCQKPMERLWISSMEDEAIRRGFLELKSGSEYEGLHQAALCRNRADWLVGINATRLFSVLYRRKLNVGRVMSPTLALIVKREVEIDSFKPQPFYTVTLETSDLAAVSERLQERAEAEALKAAIQGGQAVVEKVECKKKTEKPPVLYDLTSLQRDANRLLGFTAQQTLDYLQALYEKKLCTYPRTDSRYLTSDMAGTISELIEIVSEKIPGMRERIGKTEVSRVINDKKVTDHHAVIPTKLFGKESLSTLPTGEQLILELVALRLLCAVSVPFEYAETVVKLNACDHLFSTKGQVVLSLGWKAIEDACKFGNQFREPDEKVEKKPLPELSEGQGVEVTGSSVKEGKTTPPKHYTEDTLLSAMENAGEKDKMNFPKGEEEMDWAKCQRMQNGKAWEPLPHGQAFWRNWCLLDLWSVKRVRKLCSSFQHKRRLPLSQYYRSSYSLRI